MPHCRLAVAVGAVAFSLFAGCQPAAPPPSPSPTVVATGPNIPVSYECTPEFGGTAKPCTKAQHAAMKKKDALYAEAETLLRRFVEEDASLYRTGALVGPAIKSMSAGHFLQSVTANHREARQGGYRLEGGDFKVHWVKRLNEDAPGAHLALSVCVGASDVVVKKNGRVLGYSTIDQNDVYFRTSGGKLQLWEAQTQEVEGC